jgi:hypothetical protein
LAALRVASHSHDIFNFLFRHVSSQRFALVDLYVVLVIDFAAVACFLGKFDSTFEISSTLSVEIQIGSAYLLGFGVVQPLNTPAIVFLGVTQHSALLPGTLALQIVPATEA